MVVTVIIMNYNEISPITLLKFEFFQPSIFCTGGRRSPTCRVHVGSVGQGQVLGEKEGGRKTRSTCSMWGEYDTRHTETLSTGHRSFSFIS